MCRNGDEFALVCQEDHVAVGDLSHSKRNLRSSHFPSLQTQDWSRSIRGWPKANDISKRRRLLSECAGHWHCCITDSEMKRAKLLFLSTAPLLSPCSSQNRTPGTAVGRSSAVFNAAAAGGAATGSSLPSYSDAPEVSPEDTAKEMEAKVHSLLEASAEAAAKGDAVQTLERAKECVRREKALVKFKDTNGLSDSINLDLTFSVNLNLAQAYHINKMHTEALNTYTGLVKNKQFVQGSRLRINMGNIYSEEKKYSQAIKQYRMAVDQIPASNKNLKCKVQRNIGNCLVKCGQFQDAITAFEMVMEAEPEFPAGFNLIVCYYALGDIELMKKGFQRLLAVPLPMEEEDQEEEEEGKKGGAASAGGREGGSGSGSSSSVAEDVLEDLHALEISRDALSEALRSRQRNALELVGNAAKLIAPVIEPRDWVQGYDWVIEQLKSRHSTVCSELQICKALEYMAHRQFDRAIEDLKAFEKKDVHLRARAANNLSFLYFLEGDVAQAHKYANLAVKHDRYNAKALVNLGNCLLEQGDMDRAKELYLEAIGVEADCVEAIYNLGLVRERGREDKEEVEGGVERGVLYQ